MPTKTTLIREYTLRPLTLDDLQFQEEMLYQSLYVVEDQNIFPREIVQNPLISKYIKHWGRPGDFGLIVENKETGEKIGAAWYRLFTANDQGFGFIDDKTPELAIAIDYNYRNQGIGRHLLLSLINHAKNSGFKSLSLSVIPENAAIHLYERIGFKTIENPKPHLVMRLDIP
jgi:ribosomal protein S18 acetylase RimI-like enzyme